MKPHTVIEALSGLIQARFNCEKAGNTEWHTRHEAEIETLAKDCLPSGSGFDSGTTVDLAASTANRIVLLTSFHHMNDGGMYDSWTEHRIIVQPTFTGLAVTVTGRDRNDIKEYIGETFDFALESEAPREYQLTPLHPVECPCRHCVARRTA